MNMHSKIKKHFIFPLIVGLILLFFYKLFNNHNIVFYGDSIIGVPEKKVVIDNLKIGFNFWINSFNFGHPFLAFPGIVYPINAIIPMFFKEWIYGLNMLYYLTFFQIIISCYYFFLKLNISKYSALLSSIIYGFSGVLISRMQHLGVLQGIAWIPLEFYLVESFIQTKKLKYLPLLTISFILQNLAGFYQITVYTCLMLLIYCIVRLMSLKQFSIKTIIQLLTVFLLGFLGSAINTLSFYESILQTQRIMKQNDGFFSGSFPPTAFLELIFPNIFGINYIESSSPHWFLFHGASHEIVCYIGVIAFILFLASFLISKKSPVQISVIVCIIVSTILMLGKYGLVYSLFSKLPLIKGFRVPGRLVCFSVFFLAILCGFGMDYILYYKKDLNKIVGITKKLIISMIVFISLTNIILIAGKPVIFNQMKHYAEKHFNEFPNSIGNALNPGFKNLDHYLNKIEIIYANCLKCISPFNPYIFVPILMTIMLFFLFKNFGRNKISLVSFKLIIFISVFFELFLYGSEHWGIAPIGKILDKPISVELLEKDNSDFRVFTVTNGPVEDYISLKNKDLIVPSFQWLYNIDTVNKIIGLADNRFEELYRYMRDHLTSSGHLLNIFNIKYLLSRNPINLESFSLNYSNDNLFIYKNSHVFPKFFFVKKVSSYAEPENLLNTLKKGALNIQHEAFLENEKEFNIDTDFQGKIIKTNLASDKIEIHTQNNKDGFLFISQKYYPGWKAYVNGVESHLYKTNYIFQGLRVPAGNNSIRLVYFPTYFIIGMWITIIILCSSVLLFIKFHFDQRKYKLRI